MPAEEALRAAEEQGRQSMRELRQTLTFLRDDEGVAAPVPTTRDISALVDNARAGGLAVELRVRGDLSDVDPGVGVAVYRIAQEALANAARHAPDARTVLGVTREGGLVLLDASTTGRLAGDVQRHRLRARRHARARRGAGRRPRGRADARRLARDVPAAGGGARVIRVGLVDDQAIVRAGVARILSPEDGFEVVAECGDGVEAVAELPSLSLDVVLMDIRMPRMDGIEATRSLGGAVPVLVLTTFGEDEVLWGALEAGAAGFVLKDSSAEDLIAAVRAVAGGGAWFDQAVAPRVLAQYRRLVAPAAREVARIDDLTDREHDVLRLMARGATNAEIAGELFVAEATVKTHVGSIFMKLGVRDRPAAIVFAYDHGVVTPGAHPAG